MSHANANRGILRYGAWTRINHWLVAISFVLLVLSGLALFYPAFFGLTILFGGPVATRIVHPFIGVFMALFFLLEAVTLFHHNLFRRHDVRWLRQIGDVLSNRDERLPPVGRNNAGQKLVYWIFVLCVPVLLITGILLWRPYVAHALSPELLRWAAMIHAYVAFIATVTLIIHIYSAIWVKGSVRAMVQGRVSPAWAKHHHGLWYDEVMREHEHRVPTASTPAREKPLR